MNRVLLVGITGAAMLLSVGCSTKKYVRNETAPIINKTNELDDLTARELEVVREIARGRSNAELARELIISETTVKTHVARVLAKLRLRDRVQIVVFAYEHGLAEPRRGDG